MYQSYWYILILILIGGEKGSESGKNCVAQNFATMLRIIEKEILLADCQLNIKIHYEKLLT